MRKYFAGLHSDWASASSNFSSRDLTKMKWNQNAPTSTSRWEILRVASFRNSLCLRKKNDAKTTIYVPLPYLEINGIPVSIQRLPGQNHSQHSYPVNRQSTLYTITPILRQCDLNGIIGRLVLQATSQGYVLLGLLVEKLPVLRPDKPVAILNASFKFRRCLPPKENITHGFDDRMTFNSAS